MRDLRDLLLAESQRRWRVQARCDDFYGSKNELMTSNNHGQSESTHRLSPEEAGPNQIYRNRDDAS